MAIPESNKSDKTSNKTFFQTYFPNPILQLICTVVAVVVIVLWALGIFNPRTSFADTRWEKFQTLKSREEEMRRRRRTSHR